MTEPTKPTNERALQLLNCVAAIAAEDIDVPYLEDMLLSANADDVVRNVNNTPYKSRRGSSEADGEVVPFIIGAEPCANKSVPPAERESTSWIISLLWFLSRHAQRETDGYLRKPGNAKTVSFLKEYVNRNFPRRLNELRWSECWEDVKKFGIVTGIGQEPRSVSVHDLVSLAKAYLLEMPDSLIPDKHQKFWSQILAQAERGKPKWIGAQHLLLLLPAGRCYLLKTVLKYLKIVSSITPNGGAQLNTKGIYTCFAACISRPPTDDAAAAANSYTAGLAVVQALVEHYDEVTAVPEHLATMLITPASWTETGGATSPRQLMQDPAAGAHESHDTALEFLEKQCEEVVALKSENIVQLEATLRATPRKKGKRRKQLVKEIKVENRALKHAAKTLGQIVSNTPRKEFQRLGYGEVSTPAANRSGEGPRPAPLTEVNTGAVVRTQLRFMTPQPVKRASRPHEGPRTSAAVPRPASENISPNAIRRLAPPPLPELSTPAKVLSKYPKTIVCPPTPLSPSSRYCGQIAGSKETYV